MGSNEKAARLAGVSVDNLTVLVYVIAGLLVGVGAFLWIGMNASVDPATTGKSYEMYAIAAVVIGGISMAGGRGKVLGILFGAMSYTVIDKIIVALKMDSLINDFCGRIKNLDFSIKDFDIEAETCRSCAYKSVCRRTFTVAGAE